MEAQKRSSGREDEERSGEGGEAALRLGRKTTIPVWSIRGRSGSPIDPIAASLSLPPALSVPLVVRKEAGAGMVRLRAWEGSGPWCTVCVSVWSGAGQGYPPRGAPTNTTWQEQPWLDVTDWVDQGSITQAHAWCQRTGRARQDDFLAMTGCSKHHRRGHSSS